MFDISRTQSLYTTSTAINQPDPATIYLTNYHNKQSKQTFNYKKIMYKKSPLYCIIQMNQYVSTRDPVT